MLKNVIKDKLDNSAIKEKILSDCNSDNSLLNIEQGVLISCALEKADFKLINAIQAHQRSFVITDPSLDDNPIIFASKGFLELTGYTLEEVLGRNCRFLQGNGTDEEQRRQLGKGVAEGTDSSVCLLNYKANGTPFYNQIFVAALRDKDMNIINYVGVQLDITEQVRIADLYHLDDL